MTNFGIIDLHSNNLKVELGGVSIGKIKIPSDYVPYTFAPILGMHDLVTGDKLTNGLIVVIEDRVFRDNPEQLSPEYPDRARGFRPSEHTRASIEEKSRWALVTDFQIRGEQISFTAIYADGTMRGRHYNKSIKWAVLKQFEMLPVCENCGEVHEPEESVSELQSILSFFGSIFGGLLDDVDDENSAEIPADGQRPGETADEFFERMRDEEEARGEYDRDERAKLKALRLKLQSEAPEPTKLTGDEALTALREKLQGDTMAGHLSPDQN